MEGADDLGEALLDGHPAGVAGDELFGGGMGVVGDDDGGRVAAQSGEDELTDDLRWYRACSRPSEARKEESDASPRSDRGCPSKHPTRQRATPLPSGPCKAGQGSRS